jgi:hypothetical protein
MEPSPDLLNRLFDAKAQRRQKLAAMSFEEKIAALVRLQEMSASIARSRGVILKPWSRPIAIS